MNGGALVRELCEELDDAGLRGSFLVRDLNTGEELGIDPDVEFPSASLVKVPLVAATLERVRTGELDGAAQQVVHPGPPMGAGPSGISRFRHPVTIAVADLAYLSIAVSDNTAADVLFGLTPPERVAAMLRDWGLRGITVRHAIRELSDTPAERLAPGEIHLAHSLAIGSGTVGRGHSIPQLDVTRGSSGTARAFADLLHELWRPARVHPDTAAGVRELMGHNLLRRLAPEFSSDVSRWSSKTGTLLNLRHEIGVVEHADGQLFAVAALTESRVPAASQPGAEALMARVARALRDHLRR